MLIDGRLDCWHLGGCVVTLEATRFLLLLLLISPSVCGFIVGAYTWDALGDDKSRCSKLGSKVTLAPLPGPPGGARPGGHRRLFQLV